MKHFVALLVALFAFALPAQAALTYSPEYYPTTGPGGLSTPYPSGTPEVYAGMLEVANGDSTILVFTSSQSNRVSVGDFWDATTLTYADVQNGAGRFTKEQYARAGYILNGEFPQSYFQSYPSLRAVAEAKGNDTLAQANTQVWDIMSSPSCPGNWSECSQFDTFNWSDLMVVIEPVGNSSGDMWLAITRGQNVALGSSTASLGPVVPVPPAAWLLGSGLLGLVGVARRPPSLSRLRASKK